MAQRYSGPSAILDAMDTGTRDFASRWRSWISQWSQPQLLRLSDTYLGARLFHSSQMGGFSQQKLRQPGPMVFLAVGYINLAHGRSLGLPEAQIEAAPDIGLAATLPDTLRDLWEGHEPFTDAFDVVLGPSGLFMAFCGLRALSSCTDRTITPEQEVAASQGLGKWLRLRLASRGIDWLSELPALRSQCASAEPLLMGKTVHADRLLQHLPKLAAIAETSDAHLWDVITEALAQAPAPDNLPT